MNLNKTKIMFNRFVQPCEITVDGKTIEIVNDYIYLGQLQSMSENLLCEIIGELRWDGAPLAD